jgi:sialic acid synthase
MVYIIAEIGCSHLGDIKRAKMLCKLAYECGADYVKTQKRDPDISTPEHIKHKPHPNAAFAYGKTYLEHRKNLELPIEVHEEINDFCNNLGIKYTSSVWDLTSAKEFVSLNPDFIKIPSAINNDFAMLNYLQDNYNGEIHISLGMTTHAERDTLIKEIQRNGRAKDTVLYHTTSGYPVPFAEACILEISRLRDDYGSLVKSVGFSNHCLGIAVDVAAVVLGASHIERHFIDDRTLPHSDASASLEPGALKKLVRDIHVVEQSLSYRDDDLLPCEIANRNKLRVSND